MHGSRRRPGESTDPRGEIEAPNQQFPSSAPNGRESTSTICDVQKWRLHKIEALSEVNTLAISARPPRVSMARSVEEGYPGQCTAKALASGSTPETAPSLITEETEVEAEGFPQSSPMYSTQELRAGGGGLRKPTHEGRQQRKRSNDLARELLNHPE